MRVILQFLTILQVSFGAAICAQAKPRVIDAGFFVRTGETYYFVRSLQIIDPGLIVADKRALASGQFCISRERTQPPQCPVQKISFSPTRVKGKFALSDLRLEEESEWHRLRRFEEKYLKK